jgi:PAS domain S-box-containing protein
MALYDTAPVACLALDAAGLVVEANRMASHLFGRRRPALLGQPFLRFVAPAASKAWQRHCRQAWLRPRPQQVELALQRHGDELYVQLDSRRVESVGGLPLLRIMVADLTQRRLAETNRQIAQTAVQAHETERRRLAHALHEELGQPLSTLKMALLQGGGALTLPQRRQRTMAMLGSVDEAIATVRRIAAQLGPPMLDDLGFNAAIDALVRDTARRCGVRIAQRSDPEEPALSPAASAALYRVAQEIFDAIVSRADAKVLDLQMQQTPNEFCLILTHDGRADAALAGKDTAWRGLVHLFGGRVDIAANLHHPSRLEVRLPRDIGPPHKA